MLENWSQAEPGDRDFRTFEKKIREATMGLERAVLAKGLSVLDVDCDQVQVGDQLFKRLDEKRAGTYYTLAGEVSVDRHLYKPEGAGRPICPLDLRAGVVE